jgi:hypothetical protein
VKTFLKLSIVMNLAIRESILFDSEIILLGIFSQGHSDEANRKCPRILKLLLYFK